MRVPVPYQMLSWLGASAGLSGILVALGYLVNLGLERALGIELGARSTADLIQTAVDWLLHTLSLTWDYWEPGAMAAVIAAVLFAIACTRLPLDSLIRTHARAWARRPAVAAAYAVFLLALPAWQIISYDLAALQVRDLLLQEVPSFGSESQSGMTGSAVRALWTDLRCYRTAGVPTQQPQTGTGGKRLSEVMAKAAAATAEPDCKSKDNNHYLSRLERRYLVAFWIAIIFVVLAARSVSARTRRRAVAAQPHRSGVLMLHVFALALALCHLLLIPHVYGRVVTIPKFPKAQVFIDPLKQAATAGSATASLNGVLLAEQDKDLLMYVYGESAPLWSVPRSTVARVVRSTRVDIVWCHLVKAALCESKPASDKPDAVAPGK